MVDKHGVPRNFKESNGVHSSEDCLDAYVVLQSRTIGFPGFSKYGKLRRYTNQHVHSDTCNSVVVQRNWLRIVVTNMETVVDSNKGTACYNIDVLYTVLIFSQKHYAYYNAYYNVLLCC